MPPKYSIPFLLVLLAAAPGAVGSECVSGPGPGTYTITPDADSVRIPFEIFRGDIRMMGRVNGDEARMLVDNGALWDQLLFFGSERVDALDLQRDGSVEVGGPGTGPTSQSDLAEGITVGFDGLDGRTLTFHDQVGIITPYDPGEPNPWWGSEGQVSAQFFKHFVVDMDFERGIITLTKPEKFRAEGPWQEIPLTPIPGSPSWSIPGTITFADGRTLALDMSVDLGWNEPLGITTGQAHDIRVPDGLPRQPLGVGAQGQIFGYQGSVPLLELGGVRFRDVLTTFASVEDGGSRGDEVLVGMGIFRRFRIVWDYANQRILVRPNRWAQDPFEPEDQPERDDD